MKINRLILLVIVGILICSSIVSAKLLEVRCLCDCQGETISAMGVAPTKWLETKNEEYTHAVETCQAQCAATCGGLTDCSGKDILNPTAQDCPKCCNAYCDTYAWIYPPPNYAYSDITFPPTSDHYKNLCKKSCKSTCKLHETIHGITEIIYYIAGIIAAIMFVISGYKFITSDNPEDRTEAKKGFMFVILALIIIIIAEPLVNLLMSPVVSTPTLPYKTVDGKGGVILDVHHSISGEKMTISVTFVNNGKECGKYDVKLENKDGIRLDKEPALPIKTCPGQVWTIIIDTGGHTAWDIEDLNGGYYVKLDETVFAGSVTEKDRWPETGYEPI